MALAVSTGATLKCAFGLAPSELTVSLVNAATSDAMPLATIMDNMPMVNILPFGMCNTPSITGVAAVSAAALGVLTPMPCVPNVTLNAMPALDNNCKLMCNWGSVIEIIQPCQALVSMP